MVTYAGRPPNDPGGLDCLGVRGAAPLLRLRRRLDRPRCDCEVQAAALGRTLGVEMPPEPLTQPRDGDLAVASGDGLAERPRAETLEALLAAGVAAAPVLRAAEALESEWLWENGCLEALEPSAPGSDHRRARFRRLLPDPRLGSAARRRIWASIPWSC